MSVRPVLSIAVATDTTYGTDRIIRMEQTEEQGSHKAEIILQDSDGVMTAKDLKGLKVTPAWGFITSAGEETSATAPLWVRDQKLDSSQGRRVCTLSCFGIPDRLNEDKANDDYDNDWSSQKTVLDLVTEVASGVAVPEDTVVANLVYDSTIELRTYDVGTADLAGTIKTESAEGAGGIIIENLGTGTISKGSKIKIAGHTVTYKATATATITGNEATVLITPLLADTAEVGDVISLDWEYNSSGVVSQTGYVDGAGQQVTITATTTTLSFFLTKVGSPTGDITFRIDTAPGTSPKATQVLADASTISTGGSWYTITWSSPVVLAEQVWIWCLYQSGNASNYISVAYNSASVKAGEHFVYDNDESPPMIGETEYDCAYKYGVSAGSSGISVYDHCVAWTVTDDTASGDGLLDTYLPADAFFIRQGESRLGVIDKLLSYTKTERRFEDDDEIHLRVPVTAGSTYDYEYALTAGHTFFAKSVRDALVIPNKIVVESFPDDTDQYTGSYTSAVSYALMPVSSFVRTKLTSSDPQAIAIATARISRIEVASQRGSAAVPMNVGAELFDYCLVTDERASDTRAGNLGYIGRHYDNSNSPNSYQMTFGFGGISTKGVPGTRLSELYPELSKLERKSADETATWGILTPFIEKIVHAIDDIQELRYPTLQLLSRTVDDLTIGKDNYDSESVIEKPYLESVAGDPSPQLGNDLDLNGFNIDFPTTADISDCLDEDDMVSDSDTSLATQQSIKKYVDDNDAILAVVGIEFVIDGGGSAITTGEKGHLQIPFACTISSVTLLADQSGSIVVDIWKDTYANFPPDDSDSITASAPPTITTATKSTDTTLTGWTTTIAVGDVLAFNVDSITTCTRCTLILKVSRTL